MLEAGRKPSGQRGHPIPVLRDDFRRGAGECRVRRGEQRQNIRGSQRWVHWDAARKGTNGVLEIHGPQPQWHAMEEVYASPEDKTPGYGGKKGLLLVQDWLDCIKSGRRDNRNSARGMVATLELLDAIHQSSREGRRVECHIGPA